MESLSGPIVVAGTDTKVGKTVVTAAIAAAATANGLKVAVVKPAQTGMGTSEVSDAEMVVRLARPESVRTLTAYHDPLAPMAAARVIGQQPLRAMDAHLWVRGLGRDHDLMVIEGAGGLLSPMGEGGWTIVDLACGLRAPVVLAVRAGYGTLNHTALALEALARRGLRTYVVIGSWPNNPELVHRTNLHDLPGELIGAIPEGADRFTYSEFVSGVPNWLSPVLYGRFDPNTFRSRAK